MRWFKRKWRSVSFRSGVGASFIVGIITAAGLFLLSFAVFVSFFISDAAIQVSWMDRIDDQLRLGVAADEIELDGVTNSSLEDAFWAVQSDDGTILSSGGLFEDGVLDAPYTDLDGAVGLDGLNEERDFDVSGTKLIGSDQWLVIEDSSTAPETNFTIVTAAKGEYSLHRFIRSGLLFLIPVLLIVMTVAGRITSWFTRRALSSVEKIRTEVEQITQESLDRRVPTTGARDRIHKLADTMNDMLERLESSTIQQNQFLADASHELRSPVAGLLAQLDVAAAYPERADMATLLPKLQNEARRLQLVLDDLLFLSRSEAEGHTTPPAPGSVSIAALLDAEMQRADQMRPDLSCCWTAPPRRSWQGMSETLLEPCETS
jgi:signal transduction histidine kinase